MNNKHTFRAVTHLSVLAGLLVTAQTMQAQEGSKPVPPVTPPASSGTPAASSGPKMGTVGTAGTASTASTATMQIRREVNGNFQYRFVTVTDQSAALIPLPATAGTNNIVPLAIPKGYDGKGASLEIVDLDHSRVAKLPVTQTVLPLNESSFQYVQIVLVPVQVKGKGGLAGGTVTLATEDKSYKKSVTLTNADAGTAKFADVPLNKAVTVTVQEGANAPVSSTQTLTTPTTADGYKWNTIEVNWPDARTVPLPATSTPGTGTATGIPASGTSTPPLPTTPYPPPGAPTAQNMPNTSENPLSGIVSTVVSLLFLGGVGYGLYWAYQNGHLKNLLDKLGIQTQPVAAGGPQASPFDRPQKTPVQPITEGTADPLSGGSNFAGGGAAGFGAAPVASAGPRLVGTMGSYAGSIFPLNSTALDIGRDAGNPISLSGDTNASRKHATVQFSGGQATVTDNGSSNGTFVNGVRIAAQSPHPLRPGDEVQIGLTRFRFEA